LVYRKSTHTDLYLHAKSEHHLAQKGVVLTILVIRAKTLCDPESLRQEIQHLKCTFQQNGYSKSDVRQALHLKQKPESKNEKPTGIAVLLSHVQQISRLLAKYNIQMVHITKKKNICSGLSRMTWV
jgi:hypothetical protein